jgi:hypothetical protein
MQKAGVEVPDSQCGISGVKGLDQMGRNRGVKTLQVPNFKFQSSFRADNITITEQTYFME